MMNLLTIWVYLAIEENVKVVYADYILGSIII